MIFWTILDINENQKKYDNYAIWLKMLGKPKFNSWTGLAFERVCLLHSSQIRERLGIGGIITTIHSWQTSGEEKESGAQIDMLIDREDGVVNDSSDISGDGGVVKAK